MPLDHPRRRFLQSAAGSAAVFALGGLRLADAASSLPSLTEVLSGAPGALTFANYSLYVPDRTSVDAARAQHQAYADSLREHDRLVAGGPLLDDGGRPRGVLLVYAVASRQQAETLAQQDPFALHGAIAESRLDEWRVHDSNAELLAASLVPEQHRAPTKTPRASDERTYVGRATVGPDAARADAAHASYLRRIRASGELLMSGPFADGSGELCVYRAASSERARALVLDDPFHAAGLYETHEFSAWRLFGLNARLIQGR